MENLKISLIKFLVFIGLISLITFCAHLSERSAPESQKKITFQESSKKVNELDLSDIQQFAATEKITVWEPHEKKEVEYDGFRVIPLLDNIYGADWKKFEEVLFVALDGYKSGVSVEKIKKLNPVLAYARSDSTNFQINNLAQNEIIEAGPYYLVWDNIKNSEIKNDGAYGWPYQVNQLNLVNLQDIYPKTAPTVVAPLKIKEGFMQFKRYCMSCHAIKEEGGTKAPALDDITKYLSQKDLIEWMLNPRKFVPTTHMPPMAENLDKNERHKRAKLIYEYLSEYAPSK